MKKVDKILIRDAKRLPLEMQKEIGVNEGLVEIRITKLKGQTYSDRLAEMIKEDGLQGKSPFKELK